MQVLFVAHLNFLLPLSHLGLHTTVYEEGTESRDTYTEMFKRMEKPNHN